MRNLLWKFAALAGVTGIGFLVVLQALEGLSVKPELAANPAAAASEPAGEPPKTQARAQALPPLETKATVAFSDPFPPAASNPMPTNVPPSSTELAQAEFPLEFPARASGDQLPPPEPESADLPDLPVLIPASNQTEAPDLEAFSRGQQPTGGNPFPAPPALSPPATKMTEKEDPFADPKPLPEKPASENGPVTVPFDPYEPLPSGDGKQEAATAAPTLPTLPPTENTAPTVSAEPPFPVLAGPNLNASPDAAPMTAELPPEASADPLDLNLPRADTQEEKAPEDNPFAQETPKPVQTPGRASVQNSSTPPKIPAAPPAMDLPVLPDATQETQAQTKTPEPAPSLTFPQELESSNPVKPVADLTTPEAPKTEPAPAFPEPSADPLDQLTFPEAAAQAETKPADALPPVQPLNFPETTASEPKAATESLPAIQPRPLKEEPPASPFPNPNVAQTSPEPPVQMTPAIPPADGLEGVGILGSSVPSGPQQPELKIEKTAPPKAALGQPMIYNIVVKNVGQSAAHEVIVEDQVPQGTQLTGTIPRGEMTESRLIWRLGVIQPGEEKKIAVRVIPTQEGQIGSVAKVSFVAEVAARTEVSAAKLGLEFTGPANAVVGDAVTYHFKLSNTGTGDASKVYLRNILPEGLNHPDGSDLEYEVGTLKAGEVKEIDLTVNATKAGEFANKAILSALGGLQKEADTKVKIIGDRLTITRTGPKRRYVGRSASFSNTIANQSETKVAPVRVVEIIPAGMEFVEANAGGRFDPQNRTVTWAIAELGPRQNQLLTLNLMAKQEGPQASEVIAYDPNGTRAVVQSETTVEGYSALRLDVREYAEPLDVGEQLGLRVVAANKGTQATTKVTVKMTIPDEMEFISAKGPVDFKREGAVVTFNAVESLKAQEELEFELVLKSTKPGDARVRLEIGSDQMQKPLSREEGIRILANRP